MNYERIIIVTEKTNYKKMYLHLFNKITDSLEAIGKCNYGQAADILRAAQIKTEEIYMNSENEN